MSSPLIELPQGTTIEHISHGHKTTELVSPPAFDAINEDGVIAKIHGVMERFLAIFIHGTFLTPAADEMWVHAYKFRAAPETFLKAPLADTTLHQVVHHILAFQTKRSSRDFS